MSREITPIIRGDLRIVLLGMTGAGKSTTGNTILGRDVFKVDFSPESVTNQCERNEISKHQRTISVIDTPGLQDSTAKEHAVKAEIRKCMAMSSPGPHVFLLVYRLDERCTKQKKNTLKWIRSNFGEAAARHTIILLTHADQLKGRSLQNHIEESPDLRELVISCGGRFHALSSEDRSEVQVNELLLKMDQMVLKNEGKSYMTKSRRWSWWIGAVVIVVAGRLAKPVEAVGAVVFMAAVAVLVHETLMELNV